MADVIYNNYKPENVFVFKTNRFRSPEEMAQTYKSLILQIGNGVVLLEPDIRLEAITGPCVSGEFGVKIVYEGEK